jgi:hypothetical protein
VVIDNPEVFCLHRVKDGRDLWFFVNSTQAPQAAEVALSGEIAPLLWDPSTGEERPLAPSRWQDGRTRFRLELPPVGSAFVTTGSEAVARVVETNLQVDAVGPAAVSGRIGGGEAYAVVAVAGREARLAADAGAPVDPLVLAEEWAFVAEDDNALVVGTWLATAEAPGTGPGDYAGPDADTTGWLPMVPGAWAYQLPAEPDRPYPIPVWHRFEVELGFVPERIALLVDGFAGSGWGVFVNGAAATAAPIRSRVDSQMKEIDLSGLVRAGTNTIAIRIEVAAATDGLLDLVKIVGAFAVEGGPGGRWIAPLPESIRPESWTAQGFPFYSGRGVYRRTFALPDAFAGMAVWLEPDLIDDAVEVVVNGETAGVRLWPPYGIDVSGLLRPGGNVLELRVANTAINLLEAVERPSGLSGPPRLVPYRRVALPLPA